MDALIRFSEKHHKTLFIFHLLPTENQLTHTNFGLIELAALIIKPNGKVIRRENIINPEKLLSASFTQETGITQKFVDGLPSYEQSEWPDLFQKASKNYIVIGFNHLNFGIPALFKTSNNYLLDKLNFKYLLDLNDIYQGKFNAGNVSDIHYALIDIAKSLGISTKIDHKAIDYATLIAKILNAYLDKGVDIESFIARMTFNKSPVWQALTEKEENQKKVKRKRESENARLAKQLAAKIPKEKTTARYQLATDFIEKEGYDIDKLAEHLNCSTYTASYLVSHALQTRNLEPERVINVDMRDWLMDILYENMQLVWPQYPDKKGSVKDLLNALQKLPDCPKGLDYIQLQASMVMLEEDPELWQVPEPLHGKLGSEQSAGMR